ncbi:MAG: NAD-binding protein [Saprospiraceae bacterium]
MITTDVENYPGYPEGVLSTQMMDEFRRQAERFNTEIKYEKIPALIFQGQIHKLWTEGGEVLSRPFSNYIPPAHLPKWLGLPSEQKLMNKGVSACAVCDGFFFRGKEVAIVGGGDTAAEEASYLSKLSSKVHLLVRRDSMRASKIMQERVMNNPLLRFTGIPRRLK